MENKEIKAEDLNQFFKDYLIPLLCLAMILILTSTVFRPTLENWGKLNIENEALEKKLSNLVKKRTTLEGFTEEELASKVELIEEVYPSQKNVLKTLVAINSLGDESKVLVQDIGLEKASLEATASAKQEEIVVSFSAWGKVDEIIDFLNSLDKTVPLLRIIEVTAGNISGENKSEAQVQQSAANILLNFKVSSYYQLPPESLGSIVQSVPMLNKAEELVLEELKDYDRFTKAADSEALPIETEGRENIFDF